MCTASSIIDLPPPGGVFVPTDETTMTGHNHPKSNLREFYKTSALTPELWSQPQPQRILKAFATDPLHYMGGLLKEFFPQQSHRGLVAMLPT